MATGSILLVDDEPDVRAALSVALTRAGHDVTEAADGEQAVEALDSGQKIDLILCDVYMPKVNGLEAVTCFRSSYPAVPVIVMTGKPDDQYAKRMFELGISDFLVKPIENHKLLSAVNTALKGGAKA